MERKKIVKEDFEAIISGRKDVKEYMDINPQLGVTTCFGVHTASNPDYLIRAIYEMYETNLNKKLAIQAIRTLYRSVGMGSVGLHKFLKNWVWNLIQRNF
jgi:hypothetical protein